MSNQKRNSRGQALVLVTVSLIAIFGLIGLAVDVGWSMFVRKQARTAADAAALAAVKKAYSYGGASGSFACDAVKMNCGALTACTSIIGSGSNLESGCSYALEHGFTQDEVQLEAWNGPTVDTGTGAVPAYYWASAVVTRRVPQLFSAIFGNMTGTVSVRSTAAVVDSVVVSSFIVTNRKGDRAYIADKNYYGLNIMGQGGGNIKNAGVDVKGGILMFSTCNGTSVLDSIACRTDMNPTAQTNDANTTSAGWLDAQFNVKSNANIKIAGQGAPNSASWNPVNKTQWTDLTNLGQTPPQTKGWENGDVDPAKDEPFRGMPQPPLPIGYPYLNIPVPPNQQGINTLTSTVCGGDCKSGIYYAVGSDGKPTGAPITISGSVTFTPKTGEAFGEFVFYGGITGAGTATFHPGRYILAGALPSTPYLLRSDNGLNLLDLEPDPLQNRQMGEIFIFTDANYTDVNGTTLPVPTGMESIRSQLGFAPALVKAGSGGGQINLHGLNQDALAGAAVKDQLGAYASTLFWFDRNNSLTDLDPATGKLDAICGSGDDAICPNPLPRTESPELTIWAGTNMSLYGIIHQPRGAWTTFHSGGNYTGALQLVTGAFYLKGGVMLTLGVPADPITTRVVALVR